MYEWTVHLGVTLVALAGLWVWSMIPQNGGRCRTTSGEPPPPAGRATSIRDLMLSFDVDTLAYLRRELASGMKEESSDV